MAQLYDLRLWPLNRLLDIVELLSAVLIKSFLSSSRSRTFNSALWTRSLRSISILTYSSSYVMDCMLRTRSLFSNDKFYKCRRQDSKSSSSWTFIFYNDEFSSFSKSNSLWPYLTWFILTPKMLYASWMSLEMPLFFIISDWHDFLAKTESFLYFYDNPVVYAIFLWNPPIILWASFIFSLIMATSSVVIAIYSSALLLSS